MSRDEEYLLGADAAELARLRVQHEIWREPMLALMDAAGFRAGQTLLDLGCGPGWSTLELARRTGPRGRVRARDRWRAMTEAAERLCRENELDWVEVECADAATPLPEATFDGAYARWLFCWTPDPLPALHAVARALKPGGRLAIADYLRYAPEVVLEPSTPAFARGIAAVEASWRAAGGDPRIGEKLPDLLADAGLRVIRRDEIRSSGGPRDPLWGWPTSFFPLFMPKLVAGGFLTPPEAAAFLAEWPRAAADPRARFSAPTMLQLVAERPYPDRARCRADAPS